MNRPGPEARRLRGTRPSFGRILATLEETPERLTALTASLTLARLHARRGKDQWSANDVLGHLRACADVWGGCIVRIIAEDRPTLWAVNPRSWIDETYYLVLDFLPSLHSFAKQRAELLALLKPLPSKAWSRTAAVTGAGAVLQRTVLFYAEWLARHERTHVKQVERILNSSR